MNNKNNMQIQTEKGHCHITFSNGLRISIFNGAGSYCDFGVWKDDLPFKRTPNCEIAILFCDTEFVTNTFCKTDDGEVKGYVTTDELAKIIYDVSNYDVTKFL